MTHHADLQAVRQLVRNWLRARFASFSTDELGESILLQGGRMVGHQFHCRNVLARWLTAAQRIEVFVGTQLVQTIDLQRSSGKDLAA